MATRIVTPGPAQKTLVTPNTGRRISPEELAAALGAKPVPGLKIGPLSPISLFALRFELMSRLQSSGGRPALTGTDRRAKVPVSDSEWADLERLAAAVATAEFKPTAGQVASALLSLSVRSATEQLGTA